MVSQARVAGSVRILRDDRESQVNRVGTHDGRSKDAAFCSRQLNGRHGNHSQQSQSDDPSILGTTVKVMVQEADSGEGTGVQENRGAHNKAEPANAFAVGDAV